MGTEGQTVIVTTPDELSRVIVMALLSVMDTRRLVPAPRERKLLSARDMEQEYGIPKRTLEHWRAEGIGPEYTTVGGRISPRVMCNAYQILLEGVV
jgi:hypothetical protein